MNTISLAPELNALPLTPFKAAFMEALLAGPLLLEAEPGAGKSTLAPLWALEAAQGQGCVWLIQPRVLATCALASRLASLLGEAVGNTVGYQVPFDKKISANTRLLVMTPGILLQMLLHNPSLDGVAIVMLDEVHERALHQDLAWALLQETAILRDDLQLVLMSATPDPALSSKITNRLFAEGRCFPVQVDYQPPMNASDRYPETLPEQLLRALQSHPDWQQETVLVFLPGWKEIDACAGAVRGRFPTAAVFCLHSQVDAQEQQRAINPASGPRLILSTNIAETSLTIADVTLVIDSGLLRAARFEQRSGITRLATRRISMASARQRSGRAGRVRAGRCIRLWSPDQPLAAADLPEIRSSDYAPLALMLAHWGSPLEQLDWLEAPNPLAMARARQLLQQWQLLDEEGRITAAGLQVSALGTHPRIAALLQQARVASWQSGVVLLALALHFDWPFEGDYQALAKQANSHPHWRRMKQRWLQVLEAPEPEDKPEPRWSESLMARLFADRIGYRQESGRYRLNSGISVTPLAGSDSQWLIFPVIQPRHKGHSGVGLPLHLTEALRRQLGELQQTLVWRASRWQWHCQRLMGGVVIDESWQPLAAAAIPGGIIQWLRQEHRELPLSEEAAHLWYRARAVQQAGLLPLPALDEQHLWEHLEQWLAPFLDERSHPDRLPWLAALHFYLGYDNQQKIEALFPAKIRLPSGREVTVQFAADGQPRIAAKLQEFFGCEALLLAEGRIPLGIQLLSPNGSPLALTADLGSFWRQAYTEVKKEMRGRYPRHPWPDDPLHHAPTALTNRRLRALSDSDNGNAE